MLAAFVRRHGGRAEFAAIVAVINVYLEGSAPDTEDSANA